MASTDTLYSARAALAKLTHEERRRRWDRDGVGATYVPERRYVGGICHGGLNNRAGFAANVTIDGHRIELGVFGAKRDALGVSAEARRRIVVNGADALTETFSADCRAAVDVLSYGDHDRARFAPRRAA